MDLYSVGEPDPDDYEDTDKGKKKKRLKLLGPKKHKVPIVCPNCGVNSYYSSNKCWLCSTSLKSENEPIEIPPDENIEFLK